MNWIRQSLCPVAAAFLLVVVTGCGGDSKPADGTQGADESTSDTQARISKERNTPQQQTVGIFMDSLRRGDEQTANSMLTSKAREELAKTAYVVQPLGTPEGRFEIGDVGYPYPDKTTALVECLWHEPATASDPALVMEIVCELYQESAGWRIAGMAITVQGDQEPLVIDFENGQYLQQMLDMANGQAPAAGTNQVAQPTQQTSQYNNNLPALPNFQNGNNDFQTAQPPAALPVLR
ncbi:MAG: hypothetical protein KF752_08620 [Pirellulaceae bacterium]|nr:hypothetical protein [Pirellulaceae bacterium]